MKTGKNDDNDKMTKLMMEVFHLVKKASITRDLIVGKTHEAKRANSERFTHYIVLIRFVPLSWCSKEISRHQPVLDRDKNHVTLEKLARS